MIIRTISLEKELNEKITVYCKETGRTVSGLISLLLNKYLINENETNKDTEKFS